MRRSVSRACTAEALGTGLLLAAVVGSGIMGDRLSGGSVGLALLANSIATGAALVALILVFAPVSGAHFNPVVSAAEAAQGRLQWSVATAYMVAQVAGALAGVGLAHIMFGEPLLGVSGHARTGWRQAASEFVATFGLLTVIGSCARQRSAFIPVAVGAYITGAYWFTASTSFANPAVTLARAFTDTFTGIRPGDVPVFIGAQCLGAGTAVTLGAWLFSSMPAPDGDSHGHGEGDR